MNHPEQVQQDYYRQTALSYDDMHGHEGMSEHRLACAWMASLITVYGFRSVLDVGAGTGSAILWLKRQFSDLRVVGIEPVAALREVGYRKGLTSEELRDGNGNKLAFAEDEFDLVCEFGVLHHVPRPDSVIGEMLRVTKHAIFISDSNNFGQGSRLSRAVKQTLNALGLWRSYDYIRTRGKGYQISAGDGLFYSYSVFNNYAQIRRTCHSVHMLNTKDAGPNLYSSSQHLALFGLKRQWIATGGPR